MVRKVHCSEFYQGQRNLEQLILYSTRRAISPLNFLSMFMFSRLLSSKVSFFMERGVEMLQIPESEIVSNLLESERIRFEILFSLFQLQSQSTENFGNYMKTERQRLCESDIFIDANVRLQVFIATYSAGVMNLCYNTVVQHNGYDMCIAIVYQTDSDNLSRDHKLCRIGISLWFPRGVSQHIMLP